MKRAVSILLIFSLLCLSAFTACSLVGGTDSDNIDPSAVSVDETDPSTPVLSIGNENVTFAVYKALYESYLPYMQSTGYDPLESVSSLESFQDWIVDSLAKDLVVLYHAKQSGFALTEEQKAELAEQTESELQESYDTYRSYAEEDHAEDPSVPVDVYFDDYIARASEYYTGYKMTWDQYKEEYAREAERSFIIQKYKESIATEFEPTAEDITSWYETQYNSNKLSYQDYPGKYKIDEEYYEMNYGVKDDAFPILYAPEGFCRMMHIIVTPQGELSEEYQQHMERMEEIKAEYGDLAFEDALSGGSAHADEIAALIAEYKGLKDDTDAEFKSYSAAAYDKINQAYTALKAGQPFAEVMAEYTEDTDVVGDESTAGCAVFREKGQLISTEHTSTRDWSDGIKAEFKKLARGEYSEVFVDNGSYHIIYYASDVEAGDTPIEAVYSQIEELCQRSAAEVQWDALVEEWLNDAQLVKNESLIRALGLADVTKE